MTVSSWSDSLRSKVHRRFSTNRTDHFADSLRTIGIPEPTIAKRADSLLRQKAALLSEVQNEQMTLQKGLTDRYQEWSDNLRRKFNLDSAGVKLPNANSNPAATNLPFAGVPSAPNASMPEVPPIPGLVSEDFTRLGVSPELASVGGSATFPSPAELDGIQKSLPAMPDPMKELNSQVKGIRNLAADPGEAAKKSLTQVAEVNDATKQLSEAEALTKQADAMKAADQLKDSNAIKEQAVNHFAGKEAEVQGAMTSMAKYKKKYSSIGSLSEIPKNDWLPKNGLKGKPFKERFRAGMNLGVRSNVDTALVDIYPNASYRITGRVEAGVGGIYRLRISANPFHFDQQDPVWGFAMFALFKTFKSVHFRVETDATSHVKSRNSEQTTYRDWRWSFYTGVQTNFKISKRFTGNVQMLYSFDNNLKDGFPEKLSARIGVQYSLR